MTGFGHYGWIWLLALAAILAFALYRRGRRLIGRQRFDARRMLVRTALIAAITIFVLYTYAHHGHPATAYESAAAGFVIGAVIALFSLRFTQMGRDDRGLWYVPNLYLGIGLIALLVARFAYEYFTVFPEIRRQAEAHGGAAPPAAFASNPLLHGILFLVLGYYLVYYAAILLRARRLEAETPIDQKNEE
ncbi:MAG: hypothetical protein ACRES9_07710 [Gammaproteobacteria bacterium]